MARSVLLFLLLLESGCSPFYVFQAAYEEGRILWRRQPISELLKDSHLDQDKRNKLKLVLAARVYARDSLQLSVGGSYSGYSTLDRRVISYVLTAVPRTSLRPNTWWFPFVGTMPYKGYFSEGSAKDAARNFQDRGYDTFIRPVSAFSTLGWFDDPLFPHLLDLDKVTLVEVIFHELVHNTLFVYGAVDFNESFASFVGNRAAIDFLEKQYGRSSTAHRKAIRSWEEVLEFSDVLHEVTAELRSLFKRKLSKDEMIKMREKIFSRSQRKWTRLISGKAKHRYRSYAKEDVNNAVIVHYQLYLRGVYLFESLFQSKGRDLVAVLQVVTDAVEASGDPWGQVRNLLPSQSRSSVPHSTTTSFP